jgi:hypothetical protein
MQINPCCKGTGAIKIIRSSLGFYGEAISVYYTYSCSILSWPRIWSGGITYRGVLLGMGNVGVVHHSFRGNLILYEIAGLESRAVKEYHHCSISAAFKNDCYELIE